MAFDSDNPPQTYKKFKREVIESIEALEIEDDEMWPAALFLVQRGGEGSVIFLDEIAKDDEEVDLDDILRLAVPQIIKKSNGKYFAVIISGQHTNIEAEEINEVVFLLSGDVTLTEMQMSEVDRSEELAYLEAWEKLDVLKFPDLVVPIRRAIVYQG